MPESRLMLLDTASLYFRAFYGMPSTLTTPAGQPNNAVRGLLDFIARLITDYSPTHLACCWDNDWRPAWRVELLPSYKTHRVADPAASADDGHKPAPGAGGAPAAEAAPAELGVQVPWIEAVLAALGLAVVGADHHEADDVIGSLATQVSVPVDVVTGDRDLFQLVTDRIRVLYTARGMSNLQIVTPDWIREKYAIESTQYADFATLRGDTSDGIPGVAGIGEKTAATLLGTFGDLTTLQAAAESGGTGLTKGQRTKMLAGADYLTVGPRVVQVVRDLPVPDLAELVLPATPADPERFGVLTRELGLGTSADRILTALARAPRDEA
ncbi:5'-3' exonuclease [Granulicoccus phenolivorans]|uniref:5'-3' exonuclease n=1 Tax=Granulicoccus phenolivorans TaxID=266854 RepID=UPI0004229F19|nr:5'-3' exonuclease [Granulicoccus phenolivorans]